jgi:4-amino-4-deoxy-L-arabinose transferase-like glycosyltransferase
MPLALVIFLIGLLIWQKIRAETEWKPGERICLFALLTAAMLIKGPIVYAFLLPGIALFEWRAFKERRLGQPSISKRDGWEAVTSWKA